MYLMSKSCISLLASTQVSNSLNSMTPFSLESMTAHVLRRVDLISSKCGGGVLVIFLKPVIIEVMSSASSLKHKSPEPSQSKKLNIPCDWDTLQFFKECAFAEDDDYGDCLEYICAVIFRLEDVE